MESYERFLVTYKIYGDEKKAYEKALDICVEQTVEFPYELLNEGFIKDSIVGKIESFEKDSTHDVDDRSTDNCYEMKNPKISECYTAVISYANEISAYEITQFLNVIFGNISLKSGINVQSIKINSGLSGFLQGPKFGSSGIRDLLGIYDRPLLFSALKPMGLTSRELAEIAYKLAIGGIDIIKDDHGISNQAFSPFEERVTLCTEAIRKANRETGNNSIYVPNVTSPIDEIYNRSIFAKNSGCGGLLISPGITGFDSINFLANKKNIGIPIFSHPAFLGSYVINNNGISSFALLGQITRLCGADATIYPNFGARFPFTKKDCLDIVGGAILPLGNLKPILPCPAGGISLLNLRDLSKIYGNDVIYLIGGGLYQHDLDIVSSCKYFKKLIMDVGKN
jgi:ribulose-bisphosphate carboxylase large chain